MSGPRGAPNDRRRCDMSISCTVFVGKDRLRRRWMLLNGTDDSLRRDSANPGKLLTRRPVARKTFL